jgi:hypothetical protein
VSLASLSSASPKRVVISVISPACGAEKISATGIVVTLRLGNQMSPRAYISKPRCIYTGAVLDPTSEKLRASYEHIIPLALGGSNQFTTNDVCAEANSLAASEIDDAVAASFPFLMLRQKYSLLFDCPNCRYDAEPKGYHNAHSPSCGRFNAGRRLNLAFWTNGQSPRWRDPFSL